MARTAKNIGSIHSNDEYFQADDGVLLQLQARSTSPFEVAELFFQAKKNLPRRGEVHLPGRDPAPGRGFPGRVSDELFHASKNVGCQPDGSPYFFGSPYFLSSSAFFFLCCFSMFSSSVFVLFLFSSPFFCYFFFSIIGY